MPKVSQFTTITTIATTDLLYIVKDNGGGTFVSRKIAWSDVLTELLEDLPVFADDTDGLVPGPDLPTDDDKYLKSDGTWVDPHVDMNVFEDTIQGLVPAPAAAGADAAKFLKGDATWVLLTSANLDDFSVAGLAQYQFMRVDGSGKINNANPPSPSYTPDDESGAYSGIDNAQGGSPYAQEADLNALRVAVENLRGLTEALHTWIITG